MQEMKKQKDPQVEQYFSMLPSFVQESIQQSGVQFTDVESMQSFVNHLYNKD